jgi:hypothetical protein
MVSRWLGGHVWPGPKLSCTNLPTSAIVRWPANWVVASGGQRWPRRCTFADVMGECRWPSVFKETCMFLHQDHPRVPSAFSSSRQRHVVIRPRRPRVALALAIVHRLRHPFVGRRVLVRALRLRIPDRLSLKLPHILLLLILCFLSVILDRRHSLTVFVVLHLFRQRTMRIPSSVTHLMTSERSRGGVPGRRSLTRTTKTITKRTLLTKKRWIHSGWRTMRSRSTS